MRNHRLITFALVLSLFFLSIFLGCTSTPEEIPDGLSPAEMFQRAQDAYDAEKWDTSILYYETFIERYPDDVGAHAEAQYEIALVTYRRGDEETARKLFEDLLQTYQDSEVSLPEWPRVLAAILIDEIDATASPEE